VRKPGKWIGNNTLDNDFLGVLLCCYRWSESRMLEISAQIAQRMGKYVTDFQSYEKEKA